MYFKKDAFVSRDERFAPKREAANPKAHISVIGGNKFFEERHHH